MKRAGIVVFFFFFLVSSPQAFAQAGQSAGKTATEPARTSVRTETQQNTAVENNGATERFQLIVQRFNAAISRTEHITARVNSRIALAGKKADTTQAEAYTEQALKHIEQAKEMILQAETQYQTVLSSKNPRAIFATVQESFEEAKNELIFARDALKDAVSELKTIQTEDNSKPSATGSAQPARVTTIAPRVTSGD
jgi:predicted HNH restriction endonuclease